ncbi:hypothetical protein BJ322DRAFT_1025880, partial [Thelephora terrestris]
ILRHPFPPEKVAELLTYYLATVRPVEILLSASLGWTEKHANYCQFLYVVKGQKLGPRGLSGIISNFTEQYFKCRLTGSQLRHVLINIQHVFLPPVIDPSVQKFGDSQAGHSSAVANRVYGQRIDHLPGQEAALYSLAHEWCRKLHTVLGLGPEPSPVRPIPYFLYSPERAFWQGPSSLPPQLPSSKEIMREVHHAISSGLSFAVEEFSVKYEKMIRDTVFEAVAALSAIGVPNLPGASLASLPGLYRAPTAITPPDSSVGSELITSTPSSSVGDKEGELLRVLSLYTGRPGSTFTSDKQRLLLQGILENRAENILAVLPTGSGKSLAIFGPLLAGENGISVVVTCYTALRRQLAEQAHAFGIKFLLWNERTLDGRPSCTTVQLVIMITDDVYQPEAKENKQVVRVTLDEAHSVFLCDTYRPKMQSMIHLREVTGQKVFLTATLAPCHEPVLLKSLGIPLPRTLLLRLPTARPNHRLQVIGLPTPEAVFPSGAQLATLLLEEWKEDPGARGIFFVRSLRDLQEFTDSCLFPVCTFYGNMTGEQKDEQLNSWFSKDHPSKWFLRLLSSTASITPKSMPSSS